MHKRLLPVAFTATALVLGWTVNAGATGTVPPLHQMPVAHHALARSGAGTAPKPARVDMAHPVTPAVVAAPAHDLAPLGMDGKPVSASLPAHPGGAGAKSAVRAAPAGAPGPNGGRDGTARRRRQAPTAVHANFAGLNQGNSDCGGCAPPDVDAAIGTTQIAQTVNLRLQVYNRAGTPLCGLGLQRFFDTSTRLAHPRVQYDNVARRYVLGVGTIPGSATATPAYLLAATTGDNACGTWYAYTIGFSGALFPAGTRVDFPYLGQDRVAVLGSSNNYHPGYIGSAAWSISKATLYAGAGVSFTAFPVAFSTAPVQVAGIPTAATTGTYFLAGVPGTGYRLYRMTNSAGPGTAMALQATVSAPYTAPTRRVNQPGTAVTLDPLDGRIASDPVQDGDFVWFTHGVNLAGYPSVRYGAVGTASNQAFVATAFASATSDDFAPSIGVADAGDNTNYIFLNWAYTDAAAGRATTVTTSGVGPGEGVPSRVGGLDLASGSVTTSPLFGAYSSVSVDPVALSASCPAGRNAVVAQEYFGASGQWQTRIGHLGFC